MNHFVCLCVQGCERVAGRHAAPVGRGQRPLPARADGPRGRGALRAVRRPARGERRLRLHRARLGPRHRDLSTHAAGTHQPRLLAAGQCTNRRDSPGLLNCMFEFTLFYTYSSNIIPFGFNSTS